MSECQMCGKTFRPKNIKNKTGKRFCSCECSIKYQVGENNPSWKGGTIFSNGYKVVKIDKKYKYVHQKIMEDNIGRKISKGEVVHHVDGNKLNNNIDNLLLLRKEEHDKLHRLERRERRNKSTRAV